MRNMISTVILSLLLGAPTAGVLAQKATRTVNDKKEISETVLRVFSKEKCSLISENSREGYGAGQLAMTFRLRCETEEDSASAMVQELQSKEGFAVERVNFYPGANSHDNRPSVDVKFLIIALAGVED